MLSNTGNPKQRGEIRKNYPHGPNHQENMTFRMRRELKRKVVEKKDRPLLQVYENVARQYSDDNGLYWHITNVWQHSAIMHNKIRILLPTLPQSREDIIVPESMLVIGNSNFLIIDTAGHDIVWGRYVLRSTTALHTNIYMYSARHVQGNHAATGVCPPPR